MPLNIGFPKMPTVKKAQSTVNAYRRKKKALYPRCTKGANPMSSKAPVILGSIANKLAAEFCNNGRCKGRNSQGHIKLKI